MRKGKSEKPLLDSPIHFIGFGRGAVVNSEIVQRLGTYLPHRQGDLHMTTLDPHDFEQENLDNFLGVFKFAIANTLGASVATPLVEPYVEAALARVGLTDAFYSDFFDPQVTVWGERYLRGQLLAELESRRQRQYKSLDHPERTLLGSRRCRGGAQQTRRLHGYP